MLGILSGFRWFDSPQFMGAQGQQMAKWIQIDFIGKRKYWFALSGVVLAISIGAIAVKGLNFGIDFEGGTQVTFTSPRAVDIGEIRNIAREIGQENAVIQGRGNSVGDDQYKSFTIKTSPSPVPTSRGSRPRSRTLRRQHPVRGQERFRELRWPAGSERDSRDRRLFHPHLYLHLDPLRMEVRGPGHRVDRARRDDCRRHLCAHREEVTTATVAAILTVLGYSMYDTIIIFDRIRENIPLMRRSSIQTICNVSLWETIRRSLATTFITLLPIGALFFFGGDTLKDFAFALLVGIGAGSYSSIFIAAPLLAMWKEREPEYARRMGQPDVDKGAR